MVEHRLVFDPYMYPHDPNTHAVKKGVFTKEECDNIIAIGDTYPSKLDTMGYADEGNEEGKEHSHRESFVSWLPQDLSIPVLNMLWSRFHDTIAELNHTMWGFDLKFMWEAAQYTRYAINGHFDYHMDVGKGSMAVRKISSVLLLSDPAEYEGGVLQLYHEKAIPLEQGDVVCFPSYMLHRVTPVTMGTRRSIVLWAGGSYWK